MRTDQALQEFMNSRISSNLSPRTIEWYEDRLLPFAKSCLSLPRRPEPIDAFMASIWGSPETKRDTFNALKIFFKFICKRHRMPNPMEAINPPSRNKRVRMSTLEGCELAKVLEQPESLRDRTIVTVLVDTGMRAGEICSVLKHNIKQETVLVSGKTGSREVPISEETRELLLQLAAQSQDEFVFHDDHNKPISRFTIYRIVRLHLEKAGINGPKLGSHRMRHAFGKNFLVEGGDLRSLQEIMGHTDMKTTQKYATLNMTDIIKKHQKFSPLKSAQAAREGLSDTNKALSEADAILKQARGEGSDKKDI